ncbi:MAG: carbon-phosphorus lyase complex subunit PhnI, partial [Pseudomonadota bacterium]
MYVAVKGGEKAIDAAHRLLADRRRGDRDLPELSDEQIAEQLFVGVSRVMAEGALYDPKLAGRAIRQARGDMIEAIFLVRAYRTTLPRFGYSEPLDTAEMEIQRRISSTFKDLPGGQVLGPTFDYTHRLIDFNEDEALEPDHRPVDGSIDAPHVMKLLDKDDLVERINYDPADDTEIEVGDITRQPISYPADRDVRLQNLARGDEGFLLSLGYSTQRGYGRTHPFVGEIRYGEVELEFFVEELGFSVSIGDIEVTECDMVNQFKGSVDKAPQFTRGYGLVFGQSERKAMSMSLV